MFKARFEMVSLGGNRYIVNDHGKTVALVSQQGDVDWLLRSPKDDGPLVKEVVKDVHLSHTQGMQIHLNCPVIVSEAAGHCGTWIYKLEYRLEDNDSRLVLVAYGRGGEGKFESVTTAVLRVDDDGSRYRWDMHTKITSMATEPHKITDIEYCNIYPAFAGRGALYAPHKKFRWTIMVDKDGVAWRFNHEHIYHYCRKIEALKFAQGAMAGFFGEPNGSPVVIVDQTEIEPLWNICDMYYDLHCCLRHPGDLQPGQSIQVQYHIVYLDDAQSKQIVDSSRNVELTAEDIRNFQVPRLELGMNSFTDRVQIEQEDDAMGFRQKAPKLVWDRQVGYGSKGSLRITNDKDEKTVWTAVPPSEIPPRHTLRVRARIKTEGVVGEGASLFVNYFTFNWLPTPGTHWAKNLSSKKVTGTSDGWVEIELDELQVSQDEFDYLVMFHFILEGKGTAWLTDLDIDLKKSS